MISGDAHGASCVMPERTNCPRPNGPDHDFDSSAILNDLPGGKRALIAAQRSGVVTALDPDRGGAIIWQKEVGAGGRLGGVQWGMATDGSKPCVAVSDVRFNVVAAGTCGAQTSPVNPQA